MKKYEAFLELAYTKKNLQQAYLCYENAKFYCPDEMCRSICQKEIEKLKNEENIVVPKAAIVIVSYNNAKLMKACVESIRKNCSPEMYDLIVVDNASSDGIITWLREQKDIILVENQQNMGFPYACNQGIAVADPKDDIFLLNNDTIVPQDALFWLRMGLYENAHIGATGSISNNVVNYQQVAEQFDTIEEWMEYAEEINVPMKHPYEKKSWLVGFAMLLKRTALNAVLRAEKQQTKLSVEVLDTRFSPGNFEDNDLSIRLLQQGYELLLCKNSFIFHYGGKSFGRSTAQYINLLFENQKKMEEKYGIDFVPYGRINTDIVNMIKENMDEEITVIELGCKLGATLARIQSRYPNAKVCGMEEREELAVLAKQVVLLCTEIVAPVNGYDYVILDEVLEANKQPECLLKRVRKMLGQKGKMLVAVRNRQCVRYGATGFSLDEIVNLFDACRLRLQEFNYRPLQCNQSELAQLEQIMRHVDASELPLYMAESYIFTAVKAERGIEQLREGK